MAQVIDLGIDLGTASVVIYGKERGVILNEPAVIAIDRDKNKVLAVGSDAGRMMGRTPANVIAVRPLKDGMVSDFETVTAMLRLLTEKVGSKHIFGGPRVIMTMPGGVNEMERRSITASLFEAGVSRTQVLEKPLAAALGAGLPIGEAFGQMICDIGGGVSDIAVISMGNIVIRSTTQVAGDAFDDAIIRYIRRKHNLLIGEITAEDLKKHIGSAVPREDRLYLEIAGRNLVTGLPRVMRIYSEEILQAIEEPVQTLIESIHSVLEHTPAELAADIFENGIVLSGGGAQLAGLCEKVSSSLKVSCTLADNPAQCAARGCGLVLENRREYGKYISDRKRAKPY